MPSFIFLAETRTSWPDACTRLLIKRQGIIKKRGFAPEVGIQGKKGWWKE